MPSYRNDAKGARTIRLHGGGYILVDPGQTVFVERHRVDRLTPGLAETDDPEGVGDPPADLVAKFDGKPGGSKAPAKTDDLTELRRVYADKMGKRPFPGWNATVLKRRMGDA